MFCFIAQRTATAVAGPDQSQEFRIQAGSPTQVAGIKVLEPLSVDLQVHYQGAR